MLVPVILCGGAGSRLWPVSRELHPKPFIRMGDGQSLLQKAYLRGACLPGVEDVLTVSNRELFFKVQDEVREVATRKLPVSYVLEPFQRNTAAAVAAAALQVERSHGAQAQLLVLAADHLIQDQEAFAAAVAQARALAREGRIVTFGIKPTRAETGYGYIEAGEGNDVKRFVEKPNLDLALDYVASGRFYWNAGMFCFSAGTVIAQMERHCPDILHAVRACLERSRMVVAPGTTQLELDPESFREVPSESIDIALMEKTERIAVVPCQIGWSDIGSWEAVGELSPADAQGNRVQGRAMLHDSRGCYIQSGQRLVGAVGVENLIVIDTSDAVLVVDRSRSQDVRHIYAQLKAQGHEAHKLHQVVHRPWGSYTILGEGPQFKIKRLEVKPGAALSLQLHHHRSEHWVVVSGGALVTNGEREITVGANESTYIPAGVKHRMHNPGVVPLVVIEVQSGPYLGEDDIERFDDQYGRR